MSRYPSVDQANAEGRRLWATTTLRQVTLVLRGDGTVDARCYVRGPRGVLRVVAKHAWPVGSGDFAAIWRDAGAWAAESFWTEPSALRTLADHQDAAQPGQPELPL